MNGGDKWLDQLSPRASLCDAARVAIPRRLQAVAWRIPKAIQEDPAAVEHIHQLRVATRRCQAALSLVKAVLPTRPRSVLKQQMQKIRRQAGPVRDIDVFRNRLDNVPLRDLLSDDQIALLCKLLDHDRRQAHTHMRDALAAFDDAAVLRSWRRFVSRVRWRTGPQETSWRLTCQQSLFKLGKSYQRAARSVPHGQPPEDVDFGQLHQLRIEGKRLRYTVELSVGALEGTLSETYKNLAESQAHLGEVNDLINACRFLTDCQQQKRFAPLHDALVILVGSHQSALRQGLLAWANWWTEARQEVIWKSLHEGIGGKSGKKKGA